jgi:hypothetical protein
MPIIGNTTLATVRLANAAFAASFFPRATSPVYPSITGSYTVNTPFEPFTIMGSAPSLIRYTGSVYAANVPSYTYSVPTLLFKNYEEIQRNQIEFDTTKVLVNRASAFGAQAAQLPDNLLAARLTQGHLAAKATIVENGVTYKLTIDGQPYFSSTHSTSQSGGIQSNFIAGGLASTAAALNSTDIAVTAQQLQRDFQNFLYNATKVQNTYGDVLFPNLDPMQSVVIVVPPILKPAADLVFKTPGVLIGGTNGTSGGSGGAGQSAVQIYVKEVKTLSALASVIDPDTGLVVTPTADTCYYIFIVDDLVRPLYFQNFSPNGNVDGYDGVNIASEVAKLKAAAAKNNVTLNDTQAVLFAGTVIEHNLNAVGSSAQATVVQYEKFFISARSRLNLVYGPWFLGYKVLPTGITQ